MVSRLQIDLMIVLNSLVTAGDSGDDSTAEVHGALQRLMYC